MSKKGFSLSFLSNQFDDEPKTAPAPTEPPKTEAAKAISPSQVSEKLFEAAMLAIEKKKAQEMEDLKQEIKNAQTMTENEVLPEPELNPIDNPIIESVTPSKQEFGNHRDSIINPPKPEPQPIKAQKPQPKQIPLPYGGAKRGPKPKAIVDDRILVNFRIQEQLKEDFHRIARIQGYDSATELFEELMSQYVFENKTDLERFKKISKKMN